VILVDAFIRLVTKPRVFGPTRTLRRLPSSMG